MMEPATPPKEVTSEGPRLAKQDLLYRKAGASAEHLKEHPKVAITSLLTQEEKPVERE